MKTKIGIVFMMAGAALASEWQRNTFPSTKHVEAGFAPGAGWSHMEDTTDVSVSPLDPNFRAMIDNEWTAVYTEDTFNWKPLRMPHIGTPGSKAQSIEFSRYDADTMYLLVAHYYWQNMAPGTSPAGVWRSTDRGTTWEHLYQPPVGSYVWSGNNTARTHMLEDPSPLRSNHLYFGSTSDGLLRSTNGGTSWQTVVPELSNRRIKTVVAAADTGNETVLYAIAEKIMPRHTPGNPVPLSFGGGAPDGNTARWRFEGNLNDSSGNGNHLSGTVGYTSSSIESYRSAVFNGASPLNIQNLTYAGTRSNLSVTAWVKTTNSADQSIVSFDSNEYWELGMGSTGRLLWTVRDSGGTVNELMGPRIDDGDWHHVVGVFDSGSMRLYVDGDEVGRTTAGATTLGSGATVNGVVGSGFNGNLDDVRIYNGSAFSLNNVRATYLENERKNPLVQGQLWRIRIDASGNVSETVRLHASLEDFYDVEVNPTDPSRGWFIRRGTPNTWPFGGRELYTFTNSGETLAPSTAVLGNSYSFYEVAINPGNPNHVILVCEGNFRHVIRWSMDGGATWQGLDRAVDGRLPSIQSWLPMDYKDFGLGPNVGVARELSGSPFSFVPGVPNEIIWISPLYGGMLRSTDYGATWSTYAAGGPNKDIGQIAVAQSDPDRWSVGLYEHGWSVTTNNGLSWTAATYQNTALLNPLALQATADGVSWTGARIGQGVAFHPTNPDIMVATWTGNCYILRSTDAGVSWTDTGYRNPQRLGVDVFWSRTDANRVYAGRMKSDDAGVTWSDIGKVVISVCDSDSDLIVGVPGMRNDVTAASLDLSVSTNGGVSWTSLPDPPRETVPGTNKQWLVTGTGRTWGTMADALVAIDPGSASLRILLAGRSGIYEYNGFSNDWTLRNSGLENSTHFNLIEPVPWMGFVAFDPRPGFEHVVYAASQNDESTQSAWAGAGNPNHAYPGGENSEPFYRSTDRGITWTKLHGEAYPDAPGAAMIESMTVDSRGRMFAATTEGIYIYDAEPGSDVFTDDFSDAATSNNWATTGFGTPSPGWTFDGSNARLTIDGTDNCFAMYRGFDATTLEVGDSITLSGKAYMSVSSDTGFRVGIGYSAGGIVDSTVTAATDFKGYGMTIASGLNTGDTRILVYKDAANINFFRNAGLQRSLTFQPGAQISTNAAAWSTFSFTLDRRADSIYFTGSVNGIAMPETTTTGGAIFDNTAGALVTNFNYIGLSGYFLGANEYIVWDDVQVSTTANIPPVFSVDPVVKANATEDAAYSATLADDASDPESNPLTFTKISGPAWLRVAVNGDLSGTPANGDIGLNSFTIEVYDGNGGTGSATLEITVVNVNDAPVFTVDPMSKANATEDAAYTGQTLAGSATDVDAGATLTYSKVSGPVWLSVAANGGLTGTPANANVGANSWTVQVSDGLGGTDTAILNITVINVNDAPVFPVDPMVGAGAVEDVPYAGTIAGSANDVDAGDTLVYSKVSGPAWLSMAANGDLSGTPANADVGLNSFTVEVSDGNGGTDSAMLAITVVNVNDDPVFSVDPFVGAGAVEDVPYVGTIAGSANDVDAGDTLVYSKVSGPAWLSVAANGDLSGTPANADVGLNSFAVDVSDGNGGTDSATLEITVVNVTSFLIKDSLAARVGGAGGTTGTEVRLDTVIDAGIYNNSFQAHPVFVFQMTGVAAPADIVKANFSVGVTAIVGTPDFNTDTYVIRKDASSTILASDYETTAQLLMSGFSESADGVGTVSLEATGQTTLGTWLKNNWVEGEYVFIGLQTDPLSLNNDGTTRAFRYGRNISGWTEGSTDARLEISIVNGDPVVSTSAVVLDPNSIWTKAHGVGGMEEDFDKDGLSNLAEYALGGDPTKANDAGILPTFAKSSGGSTAPWDYVYRRRTDDPGLTYWVETCTDLVSGGWRTDGSVELGSEPIDDEFESVTNRVDTAGKPKIFIRLRINKE